MKTKKKQDYLIRKNASNSSTENYESLSMVTINDVAAIYD
jgi:hypothetical protein